MIGAGEGETLQHRARRNAIADVHHMIYHRRVGRALGVGQFSIGGRQRYLTDGFELNPLMQTVQPYQRLPFRVGPIDPGMDFNDLVGGISRRLIERHLNTFAGKNLITLHSPCGGSAESRPLAGQQEAQPCTPCQHWGRS